MASHPKKRGIYADPAGTAIANLQDKVADFSYQNDLLAEMIVKAWTDPPFRNQLLNGTVVVRTNNAKTALAARGINLTNPIVLTEREFNEGWDRDSADQVVFVLPNDTRATAGTPLLETAKLLMACTPNGI